jgi:hypothetical protein
LIKRNDLHAGLGLIGVCGGVWQGCWSLVRVDGSVQRRDKDRRLSGSSGIEIETQGLVVNLSLGKDPIVDVVVVDVDPILVVIGFGIALGDLHMKQRRRETERCSWQIQGTKVEKLVLFLYPGAERMMPTNALL